MAESSNPPLMPWSFWRPAPILHLLRGPNHLSSHQHIKDAHHLGDSKDFRICLPGTRDKDQICISYASSALGSSVSTPYNLGASIATFRKRHSAWQGQ